MITNPETGRKIKINGPTYKSLINRGFFKSTLQKFDYFEQLPEDLQNVIFKESNTLKQSQKVNKTISLIQSPTTLSYYNQYCDLPINEKEFQSYMNNFKPDKISFFIKNMGFKFFYRIFDGSNDLFYVSHTNIFTKRRILDFYCDTSTPDLKNMILIYKQRKCEEIKPGYAKNKTLKALESIYQSIGFNDYTNLVILFRYLRSSCKMFYLSTPKDVYKTYHINYSLPNATYGKEKLTLDQILINLSKDCDMMYNQLTDHIHHL